MFCYFITFNVFVNLQNKQIIFVKLILSLSNPNYYSIVYYYYTNIIITTKSSLYIILNKYIQ